MLANLKQHLAVTGGSTAIAIAFLAQPAQAQTAATPEQRDGDIVVTASKRASSTIQDIPIAVQAISGAELKSKGAIDFADFYRQVSGLSVQDEGPGDKRYVIRGINSSGAGTVGMYLDEIVITGENSQDGGGQAPDIKLFDLERVEVLKGPQGTTFGSSSMAGTIRYVTAKPDLTTWGGNAQAALRATRGATLGMQADGAVNMPIIQDVFAVRVSGFYADLPGFIDNRFEKGVNYEKSKAGRISARLAITPNLLLDGMAMYQSVRQGGKNFFNRVGYDGAPLTQSRYFQADYARSPYLDESELYNATLQYRRPFGTFTVAASRFARFTDFSRDASLAADAFFGLPFAGAGRSVLRQIKNRTLDTIEARFASQFSGPFQILIGGFLQNEDRLYRSSWPTVDEAGLITPTSTLLLDRTVDTRIRERSIFFEGSYAIMPALTFTAGGRVFWFELRQQSAALVGAGGTPGAGVADVVSSSDSGIIGRFNLAYKVSDQVNLYAQAAQGYRAGGTNDQTEALIAGVTVPPGYSPDSLWNYEIGMKTSLIDRKLSVNVAGYYIDWSQIQTSNLASNGTVNAQYTGNGGRAAVTGAEIEIDARPVRGLQINLTGNYSYARLTEDNPIPATGLKGDRVPYVPQVSGSAAASYTFRLNSDGLNATIGGDLSYQGTMNTKFNSGIDNFHRIDSYWLAGLRAGVSRGPWSVNIVATNLFDDNTIINYNDIVPGLYPDGLYITRPRTISLIAGVRF